MPWKKMGDFEVNLHYVGPVSLNNSKGVEITYAYKYNFKIKHKDLGPMSWTVLLDRINVENDQTVMNMMTAIFNVLNGFLNSFQKKGDKIPDNPSFTHSLQNLEDVLKNISKELEEG